MLAYRKEIDGLRAIAVIAVLLFHADYLPKGYLGVDIFFVISGYLITRIITQQLHDGNFSLLHFYKRRIRRIVPMLLLISIIALAIGYFTLLPDDLENLSESVIATTFFSNNVLLFLTRNYWDTANAFKPLMHTWSLGVEEQFYLIFPLLLMVLHRFCNSKTRIAIILFCIIASFGSHFFMPKSTMHFYLVSARFYQLALGALLVCISPILPTIKTSFIAPILLIFLVLILFVPFKASPFILSAITTCLTASFLYFYNTSLAVVLENRPIQFIGKISYSLYLWHHLVFCIFRLTYQPVITPTNYLLLTVIIVGLASITYYLIEQPFRNKQLISTKRLLLLTSTASIILITCAGYTYWQKGIVRDIPEMDVYLGKPTNTNSYITYNERVYKLDIPFTNTNKKKLLVIGNSYARDFVNMLIEKNYTDSFEISFRPKFLTQETKERISNADLIIIGCPIDSNYLKRFCLTNAVDKNKILVVGTKNFGTNMSWVFNTTTPNNRCFTKVAMEPSYSVSNNWYKQQHTNRYIDLISLLSDSSKKVPVFTPECKLISQDCKHLTQYGAKYLGSLLLKDSAFKQFISHLPNYYLHK